MPGVRFGPGDAPGPRRAATPDMIRAIFRARGLRWTRQRELVYSALSGTDSHPTADELMMLVEAGGSVGGGAAGGETGGLSLATVYNALDAFCVAGLVHRIPSEGGHGPARFDADVSSHAHLTLSDGRVVDAPAELAARVMAELSAEVIGPLERATGCRVTRVSLELGRGRG